MEPIFTPLKGSPLHPKELWPPDFPYFIHNIISDPKPPPTPRKDGDVNASPIFLSPAAEDTPMSRFNLSPLSKPIPARPRGTRTTYGTVLLIEDGNVIQVVTPKIPKVKPRVRPADHIVLGNPSPGRCIGWET